MLKNADQNLIFHQIFAIHTCQAGKGLSRTWKMFDNMHGRVLMRYLFSSPSFRKLQVQTRSV